ncbi:hypothetical protein [Streptomyces sp. NPDC093970]|uniref:hypothetical protein n=1 Tax=Streptomyces sp. NPDC093970 TaxID=3155076 RepID=UPI0034208CC6
MIFRWQAQAITLLSVFTAEAASTIISTFLADFAEVAQSDRVAFGSSVLDRHKVGAGYGESELGGTESRPA